MMILIATSISSCVADGKSKKADPLGINEFTSFTVGMFDKMEAPEFVRYSINEVKFSIETKGTANVFLGDALFKGGKRIENLPKLWEGMIEKKRARGVVFFAVDFGLNFEIIRNDSAYFLQKDMDLTKISPTEIVGMLDQECTYEFDANYVTQKGLFFLKYNYAVDKTSGTTYFTVVKNIGGIQINIQHAKGDLEKNLLDSISIFDLEVRSVN
jgi:hypothetical protein